MFGLVGDVEVYPAFLPWCLGVRVIEREEQADGVSEILLADMVVAFKVFRERFRSQSTLNRDALTVATTFVNGPFRHLNSSWRFEPEENGCVVHFDVDFEFRNAVLQSAAGVFFESAFTQMHKAFIKRAEELFGPKSSPTKHR